MAVNWTGFGAFAIRVPGALGLGKLEVIRVNVVTITQETTTETTQAYPESDVGILQTADTISTESTWTISINTQSLDRMDLDLVFDQTMGAAASVQYPVYKVVTVPSSTAYDVTESGLAVDQVVEATELVSASGNVVLTQVAAAGSPTAGQYEVGLNTISFNAAEAGASVAIFYKKTASLAYRGGSNAVATLGELELFFRSKTTRQSTALRNYMWFPRIKRTSGFELGTGTDAITLEYEALLPSGWNLPYMEWVA